MNRRIPLVLMAAVAAIGLSLAATPLHAADRGIRVTTVKGQTLSLYADYHALVIGVSDYKKGWPDLPGAEKDARDVDAALKKAGFAVELVLNPDSRRLKQALTKLAFVTGKEEGRAILLYFAGHGDTISLADGTELGYLVPADCPLYKDDPMGFDDLAVSMKEIESLSLKIKSRHLIMMFDSCFSGSIFSLVRAAPTDITEKSAKPVRQFITAGGPGEQVPDRSMFKIVFIDGINGEADLNRDGYVTGSELGMSLQDKVVNYTRGGQHPQYGKINNPMLDKGDFVFALKGVPAAGRSASSSQPVKPAAAQTDELDRLLADVRARETAQLAAAAAAHRRFDDFIDDIRKYGQIKDAGAGAPTLAAAWGALGRKYPQWSQGQKTGDVDGLIERALEDDGDGYLAKAAAAAGIKAGVRKNALGMTFAAIPAGSFTMGSPAGEPGRDDDEKQHRVTLSKGFYMQTTEVTQGQWKAVMGTNPSKFNNCGDDCPVEQVSWNDVQEFISKLNQRTGERYRLPTEAEWEYAARAGSDGALYTGGITIRGQNNAPELDDIAWYGGNSCVNYPNGYDCSGWKERPSSCSSCGTHPVGVKKPNALGLYDMIGNVWEWVEDWYGDYPSGTVTDPTGTSGGAGRVCRGGSWIFNARGCRSANRDRYAPGVRGSSLGFRLAMD